MPVFRRLSLFLALGACASLLLLGAACNSSSSLGPSGPSEDPKQQDGCLDDWEVTVTAECNADGSASFTACLTGPDTACDMSHVNLLDPTRAGGALGQCGVMDPDRTTDPDNWVFGKDPSASDCVQDVEVWKYDASIPADGQEHCVTLTLFDAGILDGGTVTLKGGPGCQNRESDTDHNYQVPSCGADAYFCPPPPDSCEGDGWTLTQGGWGSAPHFEELACAVLDACPDVAEDVGEIADCYGWDGVQDLGEWVTGDCGEGGVDNGFLPSGFGPGDNPGSQLIAALLNVDGQACYGLDRVDGDEIDPVERGCCLLDSGEKVGDILDDAMPTCGVGYVDELTAINESWVEGNDNGKVGTCP